MKKGTLIAVLAIMAFHTACLKHDKVDKVEIKPKPQKEVTTNSLKNDVADLDKRIELFEGAIPQHEKEATELDYQISFEAHQAITLIDNIIKEGKKDKVVEFQKSFEAKVDSLKQQKADVEKKIKTKKKILANLRKEREEIMANPLMEVPALKEKIEQAQKDLAVAREEVEETQSEIQEIEDSIRISNSVYEASTNDKTLSKTENAQIMASMKERMENLEAEKAAKEEVLEARKTYVSDLVRRIDNFARRITSK